MWYFSWALGLGLAASLGILNALWFELRSVREDLGHEALSRTSSDKIK